MLVDCIEQRKVRNAGEFGEGGQEADDTVFMSSYIPMGLGELDDPEYESRR